MTKDGATSLVVRGLDPAVVDALEARAKANHRSAEAEHRRILEEVLLPAPKTNVLDIIAEMPDVDDSVFEHQSGGARPAVDLA